MERLWLHDENTLGLLMRYHREEMPEAARENRRESSNQAAKERATTTDKNEEDQQQQQRNAKPEQKEDADEEEEEEEEVLVLSKGERCFYYQFPPTLRLQPGPSSRIGGRAHCDADYGHQDGEVNFWLPLTDCEVGL